MWKEKMKTVYLSVVIRMNCFIVPGYATEVYTLGNVSCDNYNVGFSEARGNTWNFYYSGIKKVNQLLENIDKVPAVSIVKRPEKQKLSGRLIFYVLFSIHSFTHFTGCIPLVDHTFDIDSDWVETRADMDDVADFIVKDCESAIEKLPLKYESSDDFGRATRGAAMAVKARTLLYKASPLFGEPSTEKWQEAAKASKDIIDLWSIQIYLLSAVVKNMQLCFTIRRIPK